MSVQWSAFGVDAYEREVEGLIRRWLDDDDGTLSPFIERLPPVVALEAGAVDFDSLGGGFEETDRIIRESGILDN